MQKQLVAHNGRLNREKPKILLFPVNQDTHKCFGHITGNDQDSVILFQMYHMVHLSVPHDGIFEIKHCTKQA